MRAGERAWPPIAGALAESLDGESFDKWVRPLQPGPLAEGVLTLLAPSRYVAETVRGRFLRAVAERAGCEVKIEIGSRSRPDVVTRSA